MFSDFPKVTKIDWTDKISSELKNQTLDDLDWQLEKLKISPFTHKDDIKKSPNIIPSINNTWQIGEDFYMHDLKKSNLKILEALSNGVDSPNFTFTSVPNSKDLDILFKDINLGIISLYFNGNAIQNKPIETAQSIHKWWTKNYPNQKMKGGFRYSKSFDISILKSLMEIFSKEEMTIFTIDTPSFYTGKEYVVNEIKSMILDATSFIDTLKDYYAVRLLNQKIEIPFGIDKSYFLNISKIRAFKILWVNILKAYKVKELRLPFLSAFFVPSSYEETDYTNMIRATTMAMSSVIGGVDLLTIRPVNLNDKIFAKQVARNIHHVLAMESHFDHVIDPASGSYYIEQFTEQIIKAVWKELKE